MSLPRHPVYVISKGRSGVEGLTARFLARDGVAHKIVVEPQEREAYASSFGAENILELPFSNLGRGSIPARNFVWEHALAAGHARHWILDDNIRVLYRRWRGTRIPCNAGPALSAVEDFIERFENVPVAGLNYKMFVPDWRKYPPFVKNCHVYSCLLIENACPLRWRGRYNEDTDLCLQVLASGQCTVLVNVFLADKIRTMTMKGGNAAELYKGDGRLKMARSLERVWPGVVQVKRRFKRPQHVVNWRKFNTPLRLREGMELSDLPAVDERGLRLHKVRPVKSDLIRGLLEEWGDS